MRLRDHWNSAYENADPTRLGWYDPELAQSLRLIDRCGLGKDDLIVDVGAGTSSLIPSLVSRGHTSLVGVDISSRALELAAERLDEALKESPDVLPDESMPGRVRWIVDDLTDSIELVRLSGVRLWHDRAVLHFLTSERERLAYHKLLTGILAPDGYVIVGAFSMTGARMCSGLPIVNYDADALSRFLGGGFELIESFDHVHTTPGGDQRPYVYALYRRGLQGAYR